MTISQHSIEQSLQKLAPLLEKLGIGYWMGRGVLRHWILKGEIGDKQSDLDFHVWENDKEKIGEVLGELFEEEIYHGKEYKCVFRDKENGLQVEFMFLRECEEYPDFVYHERKNGKFYFPKACVASFETITIFGIKVRIPTQVEQYMIGLYGPDWKQEGIDDKNVNIFRDNVHGLRKFFSF